MTWDAASLDLTKQIAAAVCIGAFQGYNMWQHKKNAAKIHQTQTTVAANYDALTTDFDVCRKAIERMTITMQGGVDRRRPSSLLTEADGIAARRAGFGSRWTDAREPRPPDAPPPPSASKGT